MAYTPEIRTCPVCGQQFTAFIWNKHFCSDECSWKARMLGLSGNRCGHSPNRQQNAASKKRRCHDCHKPTNNYRCDECWRKIRKKNDEAQHSECYTEWEPYTLHL